MINRVSLAKTCINITPGPAFVNTEYLFRTIQIINAIRFILFVFYIMYIQYIVSDIFFRNKNACEKPILQFSQAHIFLPALTEHLSENCCYLHNVVILVENLQKWIFKYHIKKFEINAKEIQHCQHEE